MDRIQNYGAENYQIGFQKRGTKKVVKTLADKIKGNNVPSQEHQYKKLTPQEKINKIMQKYETGQYSAEQAQNKILHLLNVTV